MQKAFRAVFLGLAYSLVVITSGAGVLAAQCVTPTQQTKDAVITYAGRRFHVNVSAISIVRIENIEQSCFWALHLQASNPARTLTLYLSPDARYLTPILYDMTTDPLSAEKAEHESVTKQLTEGSSPELGYNTAPITIVEFSDFQCPYCKRMAETLAAVLADHSSKDIKVVYKNFPLPMHSWAGTAARVGRCVEKLQPVSFWPYHDYLFSNQALLTAENIRPKSLSFLAISKISDRAALELCIDDPNTLADVQQDIQVGRKLGVNSTPTIFVNGEKVDGAQSALQLKDALDKARADLTQSADARPVTAVQRSSHE